MDRTLDEKQSVDHFDKARTTIRTLAPELLSEIFTHCIVGLDDEYNVLDWTWIRCSSQAPLLLGRVCRRWRSVSISSPDLWCTFAIGGEALSHVDLEKDLEALKYWNSKSHSRPLSIRVYYHQSISYGTQLTPIIEYVVSQSWRWKEIKLTYPFNFEYDVFAPFQTRNLPQLVMFQSETIGSEGSAEFVLSSAPRLQSLIYSGSGAHVDFSGGPHGIKQIDIYDDLPMKKTNSVVDLFTCFTQCPLLEDLSMPLSIGEWEISPRLPDELPSTIALTHLAHLNLWFLPEADPRLLFDRLFLPALISLRIHILGGKPAYADWPHVRTMLAHSRPPLHTLKLYMVPMKEATLVGCLAYIPTLTELDVFGVVFSDYILESLTVDEADANISASLCPWLQKVALWSRDYSERAMIEMIVSRRKHALRTGFTEGIALKSVTSGFDFDRIRSNPDIAECVKDGLKISY
ncbi:hypothetical protein BD410DRAFT_901053 [Rickenella mellea]|uniref:F-box domain-containing protein n=1 Tax=Rickenella mellea TaxID=50990 RepID=A0A4Y7PTG4_9AGAM|nr:hypothetical protein BD410DRAFT_901053 [Rickenella mellea]